MALILAPMVRGSFPAMRTYCLQNEADYVYTDVIMAKALIQSEKRETDHCIEFTRTNQKVLLIVKQEKSKTIIQLAGTDFDDLNAAALLVKDYCLRVDLNLGCAKHFTSQCGAGGVLGTQGTLAADLLKKLSTNAPWSVKTRLRDTFEEALQHILDLLNANVQFIAIHCRKFNEDREKTRARWDEFFDIYEALNQEQRKKIIFNGGLINENDYFRLKTVFEKKQLPLTPVLLARGAIRDPEIFRKIKLNQISSTVHSYRIYQEIGIISKHNNYKFCDYKACVMFSLKWIRDLSQGMGEGVRDKAINAIQEIAHHKSYDQIIEFLKHNIENGKLDEK
ncbi:tRNA-dihydrouridine synthase [Spironucleus salmonicida]|uniref:tRNA-dihydrouridine synthase n=1 Tax=Spironucleus salmonicida TaxID=348837 RepID=V6M519_9EUKA|nr:tRNA-dihydrouridine synthase [Spironucleus salmonicida]|eukprot:EST48454.1 Dihydrouridine synthase-like (DUS-like) FMN-binding domain-containing protein [Spironucleus salmonicida]